MTLLLAASAARLGSVVFFVDRDWWAWSGWAGVAALAAVFAAIGTVGALFVLGIQFVQLRAQVDLAQRQYLEARKAARPLLETGVSLVNPSYFSVAIRWIHGTQPAFDVTIWIKHSAGVFVLPYGTLPAQTRVPSPGSGYGFATDDNSAVDMAYWPFSESDTDEPLGSKDFWAGITWHSDDQYQGRYLIRCRVTDTPGMPRPFEQRFFTLVDSQLIPPPSGTPDN